jgi:hypothetical protein
MIGITICGPGHGDRSPAIRHAAVVYDLDAMPRPRRCDLLRELMRGPSTCPTAVHGYALTEDQAALLSRRGVAVAQRLEPDLFQILRRTVLQNLSAVCPEDALVEKTWINVGGDDVATVASIGD